MLSREGTDMSSMYYDPKISETEIMLSREGTV